jgi:hypothetical protein
MHYRGRLAPASWPPPVYLTVPRIADFCCVPVSGPVGIGITVGQWLDGDRWQFYDHTEIYVGRADAAGPYGYTVATYPNGGGKRALPCPPVKLPGSLWSSGLFDLTGTQRADIVEWALEYQDTRYSFLDYGALVLHGLGLSDPALQRYIQSTRHMICSQCVDAAYTAAGVALFDDGRWPGYVKPGDLAGLLEGKIEQLAQR